jgi:tetratricopeptide (TPR) repeat protein
MLGLVPWGVLALAGAPLLFSATVPEQSAAMIQRYRETADGSYLTKAEALLEPLLKSDPANAAARRIRLELAMFRHEFPKVVEQAMRLVEENPRDRAAWAMLGDALMERGEYDRAGTAYERLTAIRANQESYNRLAWHRWVTGRKDEALGWMRAAVAAGSKTAEHQAWCLLELAEMAWKADLAPEARAALDEARRLFPNSHRARAIEARMAAARGDAAAAKKWWREAIAILPQPEYAAELALLERGPAAEHQWAFAMKIQDLAAANGEKANRMLALRLADAGRDLDRALALAEAEFEVRNDVYSYDAKAWVLFQMGRLEEAREAMREAVRLGTPEPSFRVHARAILGE